jgi:exopolyphosphatase / guanosine-5'-triphosphate,3'-diphosphate pyrophosphatase
MCGDSTVHRGSKDDMRSGGAVAAIDCGTNSTRLLVTDPYGAPLERQMRITRLGEGVDETGVLSAEAIDRCLSVLKDFRTVMDRYQVRRGRVVATSAARDAINGEDFLRPASEVTGYPTEVLAGVAEGRLSLAGAVSDLEGVEGPFLVLDIGGGSTELVAGTGPDDPELEVDSLQIGCVRVTERYLESDPPKASELLTAESVVSKVLEAAVGEHPRLLDARRLIGLAGTITTLAALRIGLADYDRDRIHHSVLTVADVMDWYRTLASEDRAARLDRAGMVAGREDVIVAGAMILAAVMTRLGFDECLVSEADILDGLVASQLSAS